MDYKRYGPELSVTPGLRANSRSALRMKGQLWDYEET